MARKIQETTEEGSILEAVEAAESHLRVLGLELAQANQSRKEAKQAYDEGVAELRRAAGQRLEENPLLDAAEEDEE